MAETLERLRRTTLVVPRLMRAHTTGQTLSLSDIATAIGTDSSVLLDDLHALQEIEFETEERPNYFDLEMRGDGIRVNAVPLVLSGGHHRARLTEPEASALLSFLEEIDTGRSEVLDDLELRIAHAAGAPEGVHCWSSNGPIPAEEVFTALLAATRDGLCCTISYTGRGGELYDTMIEPYHLRMERGLWYVIARLAEGPNIGAERCYRLDKVAAVDVGKAFESRPIDIARYSDGVFRPSGEPRYATVSFSETVAPYAEERWGTGTPVDGGVELEIEYYDEGWLERTLAVFGGEVRLLAERRSNS